MTFADKYADWCKTDMADATNVSNILALSNFLEDMQNGIVLGKSSSHKAKLAIAGYDMCIGLNLRSFQLNLYKECMPDSYMLSIDMSTLDSHECDYYWQAHALFQMIRRVINQAYGL